MENIPQLDRIVELEAKIDALTKTVKKIDRTVNPPWWKNILLFLYHNFFTLLVLATMLFFVWKAWMIYQNILVEIQEMKAISGNMQDSVQMGIENSLQNLKFW